MESESFSVCAVFFYCVCLVIQSSSILDTTHEIGASGGKEREREAKRDREREKKRNSQVGKCRVLLIKTHDKESSMCFVCACVRLAAD